MPDQQPLKLLVITVMYEPDCVGIAAIASDMCAALAERGHDVTVYTSYPYYPEWNLKAKANWQVQEELIRDVHVRRHRIFVPAKPSRLIPRLIHELSFPISLLRSLFYRKRYDVVTVYCPAMGGMLFAALQKLFLRVPLWVNVQDIPVGAAAASGIIQSSLLARLASITQKFLLNRADVWSSISPDMIQQLETIKNPDSPIHLFPNWLTRSLEQQIRQLACKVGRMPGQTTRLLYCGTIGKKQGLLQFCKTLSRCDGDFQFIIRGDGGEAEAVRDWVLSNGDPRFEFGKLLPQSEFVNAIHQADWFVIPQKSSIGCAFFPSKLIPSISIGTPILAISEQTGPLGREVIENDLGLVVPWSEVNQVTCEFARFRHQPERFGQLQRNCLRRARVYSCEAAVDRYESLLQAECCRSTNPVPST